MWIKRKAGEPLEEGDVVVLVRDVPHESLSAGMKGAVEEVVPSGLVRVLLTTDTQTLKEAILPEDHFQAQWFDSSDTTWLTYEVKSEDSFDVTDLAEWSWSPSGIEHARDMAGFLGTNPVVSDDYVVATTGIESRCIVLRRETGDLVWQRSLPDRPYRPVVWEDSVIAFCVHSIQARAIATGEVRWTWTIEAPISNGFQDGRHAYVLDRQGSVCCLDARTGRQLWKQTPPGAAPGPNDPAPAISNGFLVANVGKNLLGMNPSDGSIQWTVELPDTTVCDLGERGGEVLIRMKAGLVVVAAASGEILQSFSWNEMRLEDACLTPKGVLASIANDFLPGSDREGYVHKALRVLIQDGEVVHRQPKLRWFGDKLDYWENLELVVESTSKGIGFFDPATMTRRAFVGGVFDDRIDFDSTVSRVAIADGCAYTLGAKGALKRLRLPLPIATRADA